MEKGRFFDIIHPSEKSSGGSRSEGKWEGFGPFLVIGMLIFFLFSGLVLVMNGSGVFWNLKNTASAGYDSLVDGASSLINQNFKEAGRLFEGAEGAFQEVGDNMRSISGQADDFLGEGLYLDAAQKLISSGLIVSTIGRDLTTILEESRDIPMLFAKQNNGEDSGLIDAVRTQKEHLDKLKTETVNLQESLTTVNTGVLPSALNEKISDAREKIGVFLAALNEMDHYYGTGLKLLGDKVPHSFLILFQNNHELRAGGGFLGSYMLLDMNDGKISKMDTIDVYQTDGQLVDVVPAPPGIDKVADRLYMRDANYSPDFPTTARQVMWFLEHSRGPSVDTVIAIDQTVAEAMLEWTGPLNLENFPYAIRADNFNDLVSYFVEAKLSETQTPKQILIDLMPVFKEKLLSMNNVSSLAGVMEKLITGRHIQVYSSDPDIQALAQRFNADSSIIAPRDGVDYLSVVTTSIGGNKSDAYIHTTLDHQSAIESNGTITDELTISKTHTWKESDFAYWKKLMSRYGKGKLSEDTLRFIQGAGDNVDYLRVYVPRGSTLVGVSGVDHESIRADEDLGYTVFSFVFGPVSAGQTKDVTLNYRLPFQLDLKFAQDIYGFIAQKQPGAENITLKKSLELSDFLKVVGSYPENSTSAFSIFPSIKEPLESNQIFLTAIAGN